MSRLLISREVTRTEADSLLYIRIILQIEILIWCLFFQDHNIDFIVKFPDWDPSANTAFELENMTRILSLPRTRRFLPEQSHTDLPRAHLWYSPKELVNALRLFLAAGDDVSASLPYR